MIQVALIEDDDGTRQAWELLLNQTHGFRCVSSHRSAEAALADMPSAGVDIALVDLNLPRMDGCGFIRELKRRKRELLICVFTVQDDADHIFASLKAGASGYLLKRMEPTKIFEALRELKAGGAPMSPGIARKVIQHFHRPPSPHASDHDLTAREREVLELIAQGLPDKVIGDRLKISTFTVRNHVGHI